VRSVSVRLLNKLQRSVIVLSSRKLRRLPQDVYFVMAVSKLSFEGKKVMATLQQAMKAQRGSRIIVALFLQPRR
jgi:hypothetical protein